MHISHNIYLAHLLSSETTHRHIINDSNDVDKYIMSPLNIITITIITIVVVLHMMHCQSMALIQRE